MTETTKTKPHSQNMLTIRPPGIGMVVVLSIVALHWTSHASRSHAQDVLASAASGQPYGVGVVEIPIAIPVAGREYEALTVSDESGRILFQVSNDAVQQATPPSDRPLPPAGGGRLLSRVGELVRELAGNGEPVMRVISRRVSFLFEGSQPIRLTLREPQGVIGTYEIVPQANPAIHGQLLSSWWSGYASSMKERIDAADYPPVVETYLTAMLSQRTGMPVPDWFLSEQESDDQLIDALKLIAGAEEMSNSIFRRAAVGTTVGSAAASLPLPDPPQWAETQIPGDLSSVVVEPMATRVPPECFYIRYGAFENFLWFNDLSDEYGGDISHMVTLRGISYDGAARIEDQLSMKMTQLARMFGGTVIEDQAVIGTDLFLADGASIGVLIKSPSMFLLQAAVNAERSKVAGASPEVTLKNIQIGKRTATLLSSADQQIRSFLAIDGDYMLVANSRRVIERFFEVADTGESLAETRSFRLARQLMPVDREDTIFAYFSPAMLQNLISPESLIELRRRLYAKADITLVRLARLAAGLKQGPDARSEGIDELVRQGFLPGGFGNRSDGSGAVLVGENALDTLRGTQGTFVPIADVQIDSVSPDEANWYEDIAQQYSERFPTFDPIMVGVKREVIDEDSGRERVSIHAEIAPWDPGKYGKYAEQLGPPTTTAMSFPPDDIVTVQAHVASALLGPPTHMFVGIKDSTPPPPQDFDGILRTYVALKQIPGYLGAWPQPGALDRLPLGLGRGQPIGDGMSRLIGGLYRYTDGQFSVISFQPEILRESLSFLQATEVEDMAQVRIHVGNLNGSQLEGWVNGQLYERARDSSLGGARFLSLIATQFNLPSDRVIPVAEQILAARLQCTLGGTYEPSSTGGHQWISSAWQGPTPSPVAPADYVAPMMKWFRGADASLTQLDDRVVADAVVDLARQ